MQPTLSIYYQGQFIGVNMNNLMFLNIGWMERYRSLVNDEIEGGGSFVDTYGYGHEMFNFLPWEEKMYGHVQAPSIGIWNLDAKPRATYISNVLAVWVARNPNLGGTYIVGWYDNATVYSERRRANFAVNRRINEHVTPNIRAVEADIGRYADYYVSANEDDCTLIPPSERAFLIPRGTSGDMGRANVWYADHPNKAGFRRRVIKYIRNRVQPVLQMRRKYGRGGEGDDHRTLKEWCSNSPQEFGLENVSRLPAETEHRYISGDSVDVLYEMPNNHYAVLEVETTDALTGAYQALKYRTLLCAEKGLSINSARVKAMLVAWRIPQDVRLFCESYGIHYFERRIGP